MTKRRGRQKQGQKGMQPLEKFMCPVTRSQSSELRRKWAAAKNRERIPVRVVMTIEGETNVLLFQPVVGPWETLQVESMDGDKRMDADAVLVEVAHVGCFQNSVTLEQAAQVQLQYLGQQKACTVDVKTVDSLQLQDKGRWVWTPATCLLDGENTEFTKELPP